MVGWRGRNSRAHAAPAWRAALTAGGAAGAVAAVAGLGLEAVTHSQLPPRIPTMWSAWGAGILGGILYGVLVRVTRRPVAWLWALTLGIATIDTLLVTTLPLPAEEGPRFEFPIIGLTVPFRQLLALVGIGHFSTFHLPGWSFAMYTIVHYITAVAVALLVPWWAGPRRL